MTSINASGLANLGLPPVNLTGFVPVLTFAVTWGTHIIFTDVSTFPSGDTFKVINISINDEFGGVTNGTISASDGTATIDTSGSSPLAQTGKYFIKATVVSTLGCIADGFNEISRADTSGTEGNYRISFTTANHS